MTTEIVHTTATIAMLIQALFRDSIRSLRLEGAGGFLRRTTRYLARELQQLLPAVAYWRFCWKARLTAQERDHLRHYWGGIGRIAELPLITIVVPIFRPHIGWLKELTKTIENQIYPRWEAILVDDGSDDPRVRSVLHSIAADRRFQLILRRENGGISVACNDGLAAAQGDFVTFVDQDDLLAPEALDHVTRVLLRYPDTDLVYSDEDKLDSRGHRSAYFPKPGLSDLLLLQWMYMCHLLVYRARRLKELGGFRSEFDGSQDHDMALRFCEITDRVQHIPRVLYHWRRHDRSFSNAADSTGGVREAGCRAVEAAIVRRGLKATVTPTAAAGYRVAFTRSWSPRVSVVIPMRDRPELLRRLLGSIEAYRTYPNYELLVVDNASVMPETLSWLAGLERTDARIRVLRDGRAFNFSRLNNVAAAEAHGDVLLFLNNDTEVTHDDWLEPMLEHITRPDVGAVGTLLLFPNGTVQHAGITVAWPRGPAHKFRRWPVSPARNLVHYQAMTFDSDVAAVTGACMMVRRDVYHSAGGFDEEMFPVAFNDVDLCLRLRGMGHRIVFTPRTRLVHHESVSRGTGYDPYEVAALEARWKARCGTDPFWNPNLLSHNEGMLLARPWRMPEDGVLLGTLADTGRIQRPGE